MTACWCGETQPSFTRVRAGCFGTGIVECLCGGENCVCHNHGEIECMGCVDCEPTQVIEDDDLFCHEDGELRSLASAGEPYRYVSPTPRDPLK